MIYQYRQEYTFFLFLTRWNLNYFITQTQCNELEIVLVVKYEFYLFSTLNVSKSAPDWREVHFYAKSMGMFCEYECVRLYRRCSVWHCGVNVCMRLSSIQFLSNTCAKCQEWTADVCVPSIRYFRCWSAQFRWLSCLCKQIGELLALKALVNPAAT